jgi:prostaglandin-endoperoxide synthase 2
VLEHEEYRFNNALVDHYGVERIIDSASRQPAGLVGLHNTPSFLLEAEKRSILLARQFRLAPFNAYRRRWQLAPYKGFLEMTGGDVALARELDCLYPDRDGVAGVDRVEFSVGLFAETRQKKAVLPTLLSLMVASDAFSHALTNPLLAAYVFGQGALTDFGVLEVERVDSLFQIVKDNITPGIDVPLTSFELARG